MQGSVACFLPADLIWCLQLSTRYCPPRLCIQQTRRNNVDQSSSILCCITASTSRAVCWMFLSSLRLACLAVKFAHFASAAQELANVACRSLVHGAAFSICPASFGSALQSGSSLLQQCSSMSLLSRLGTCRARSGLILKGQSQFMPCPSISTGPSHPTCMMSTDK